MTRAHRLAYAALWLGTVLVVALLIHGVTGTARQAVQEADHSASVANRLAEQVRSLGATPVATPPATPRAGSPGSTGPQGPPGPAGPSGSPGARGAQGHPGPVGPAGNSGTNGTNGETGAKGETGPTGATGPTGEPGPIGPTGPAGYPSSFTGNGFTCTDPDGDHNYDCTREGGILP